MRQNRVRRVVFAAAVCVLVARYGLAGDWGQFRGPGGQGVSNEKGLPTTWSDSENLAWKTALPGYGSSSPIVLGDRLYVTCYSGYAVDPDKSGTMQDLVLHVLCVNRGNGKIVWDEKIKPKLPESPKVRDHGYTAATPATDGKALYVFFGKTGVLKLDLNGKTLWQTDVGSKVHGWGCGTSPVLFENLVIVNASVESGSLVALDKTSGKKVWSAGGMNSSWNTPHLVQVDGKQELVVCVKDRILAFNPATGDSLWSCEGIHDYVCPSIVSQNGIVYAIGGRSSQAIAVKAGGRGDVTGSHRLWVADVGANVSSPVIHDGHLYWVSDRNNTAYCISLRDGAVKYSERFRAQPYASTVLADGKLYVVTRRGGTFVLAARPAFEQLAHNKFEDRSQFNASPAVADGCLYLRSDHNLYCVGK